MATSLANLIGGDDSGPMSLVAWGTLTAGSRTVKVIDNQKSGADRLSKDGVRLIAHYVNHASATAGIKIHIWPIDVYVVNAYVAATHMMQVQANGYRIMEFGYDKGDSAGLTTPVSTDLELDLSTASEAAKFTAGDMVIVDPASGRTEVFTVLSTSGEKLQVDRQIGSGPSAGDRTVNYQRQTLDLQGVPYLGWLIVVEELDGANAPQFELEFVATAGSVLS